LPSEKSIFAKDLKFSLCEWEKEKVTGIWIHIPKEKIVFLEEALNLDFYMHHCEPNKIVVAKWLVDGVENKIPKYSTHYVGSGG
jgi:Nudix hydrolase domain